MTTILAMKLNDGIIIGADTQTTSGNMVLPFYSTKLEYEASNIIGGSGSVGSLQRVLAMAIKEIKLNRVL